MEDHFKKFVILFTILASAADCEDSTVLSKTIPSAATVTHAPVLSNEIPANKIGEKTPTATTTDLSQLEGVVMEYLGDVMNKKLIKLLPGLSLEMKNETNSDADRVQNSEGDGVVARVGKFFSDRTLKIELARSSAGVETGRFFFFKGESFYSFRLLTGMWDENLLKI